LLAHDQQAATQDSTTSTGTQARYNNWEEMRDRSTPNFVRIFIRHRCSTFVLTVNQVHCWPKLGQISHNWTPVKLGVLYEWKWSSIIDAPGECFRLSISCSVLKPQHAKCDLSKIDPCGLNKAQRQTWRPADRRRAALIKLMMTMTMMSWSLRA